MKNWMGKKFIAVVLKLASQRYRNNEQDSKSSLVIYSALLGLSIVATIQLLQVPELDLPLTISLYAFAVNIPPLAVMILSIRDSLDYEYNVPFRWLADMGLATGLISLLAVVSIFWHFSWIAGVLVIVSGAVAFHVYTIYLHALKIANRGNQEETQDPGTTNNHDEQ